MAATRAQKIRLGIFLIVSTAVLAFTLIYLVGSSLLEERDHYYVVLQGGSGGLEIGSQVRFNDILVGRVESVTMDKDDPMRVVVWISLNHETPVTKDTVAVPEMANITGSKVLSMRGGNKSSERLKPGDEIQSTNSDFSQLTGKVVDIAEKLELLVDNLVVLTGEANGQRLNQVLVELEGISKQINQTLGENSNTFKEILVDVQMLVASTASSVKRIDAMLERLASTQNLRHIDQILLTTSSVLANVKARTSEEELGKTMTSITALSNDTQITVLRLRDDLRRIMTEIETSVENLSEFTQMLIDNPAALISGRNEKERKLP